MMLKQVMAGVAVLLMSSSGGRQRYQGFVGEDGGWHGGADLYDCRS